MNELELGDLTHIERAPLPWRTARITECGLSAERHPTWTREEAHEIRKRLGVTRFVMHACMTCNLASNRHATWDTDPRACIMRYAGDRRHDEFVHELRAIATLIERHREEFDTLVADHANTVDIGDVRRSGKRS